MTRKAGTKANLSVENLNFRGDADVGHAHLFETGNGIYKAMSIFAKAKTAGIIVGGRIPIAMSSRCDSEENVFHSLVLGALHSLSTG